MTGVEGSRFDAQGRYEVTGRLGAGGMGEVFVAHDNRLRRRVALKVLRTSLSEDADALARFEREARAAASIQHPGIVAIYDIHMDAERPFIVMELCSGRSLDKILEEAPLSASEAIDIGSQVADALAAAHSIGLVHRDVKPANIMVLDSGAVKVADFGIAWASPWTPISGQGIVQGTPTYYSPEQASGDGLDGRSDIYSLGVVLYESVAGRPPHIATGAVAVALKHIKDEPTPLARLSPETPRRLTTAISRCLEKLPERRFATAADLAGELRNCGPGEVRPAKRLVALGPTSLTSKMFTGKPVTLRATAERETNPGHKRAAMVLLGGLAGALTMAAVAIALWAMLLDPSSKAAAASKPLGTPSGIKAGVVCGGLFDPKVTLEWSDVKGADGYVVYRRDMVGSWQKVDLLVGQSSTSWSDSSVDSGTAYLYEVKATQGSHLGRRSRMVTADTPSFCT